MVREQGKIESWIEVKELSKKPINKIIDSYLKDIKTLNRIYKEALKLKQK